MVNEFGYDIAQLAYTELFTPKLDESLKFFTQYLGMQVTKRVGNSIYLRAYEETYHHSLKLTERDEPGVGAIGWRATSPEALQRRTKIIKEAGYGIGWSKESLGRGEAYQFKTPFGHQMELFWDVEYYKPMEHEKTELLNRATKRPSQGVPVRRIDHLNLLAKDVGAMSRFLIDVLGFKMREYIVLPDGNMMSSWLSVSNLVHEIAISPDFSDEPGRLHHLAYWYGYPQNLYDVGDLLKENGIFIEAGPGKHGISGAFCMYVYEPGGNRIELFGDTGYLIFDPSFKPVVWKIEDLVGKGDMWIGSPLPPSFNMYGTPIRKVEAPPIPMPSIQT